MKNIMEQRTSEYFRLFSGENALPGEAFSSWLFLARNIRRNILETPTETQTLGVDNMDIHCLATGYHKIRQRILNCMGQEQGREIAERCDEHIFGSLRGIAYNLPEDFCMG